MFQWVSFGKVKYDGVIFNQDVLVSSSGDVFERLVDDDPLVVSLKEVKESVDDGTRLLIVGTGFYGLVCLSSEANGFLRRNKIKFMTCESPKAVGEYNKLMSKKGRKPKVSLILHLR